MIEEIETILDEWDPEDMGNSIRRLHEVRTANHKLNQILEALEKHITTQLKDKGWEGFKDEKSKISIKLIQLNRKSIDKDKLKIALPKSKIEEIIKITKISKLEVVTDDLRKRIKRSVKPSKTQKPKRYGAQDGTVE